ncbi:MAG: hypothetical protein GPJ54_00575 [Candidatus Heimdallarchaeota archaeon]|nr:hypothetical protein [Candidatus Heimdallarchaeota archaeon]
MRFRKAIKIKFRIRNAKLDDSDYLSELQLDYLERYSTYETPKPPEKYRLVIGSGLLTNERIIIIEDSTKILGFIEQKKINPYQLRLSYPFVLLDHEDREELQLSLLEYVIEKLKTSSVRVVNVEFSSKIEGSVELFHSFEFKNQKSIFQSWEGLIIPKEEIDIEPFDVRRVKSTDLDVTYDWIKDQLDRSSPLFITKETYASLLLGPSALREGWAIATIDDKPVAFVSSIKEDNSDVVIIFGPYCDESFVNVRIPLLNELFLYYKMRGYEYARLLRIDVFENDTELFDEFNLMKNEEILSMSRLI